MTSLELVSPSVIHRGAFVRLAREWRAHGHDRYGRALEDFDAYLDRIRRGEAPVQPPGRVPGTEFWLTLDEEEVVGCVRLRFVLTPDLEAEGGHVGYDIRPSARGKGYGSAALRLVIPEARRRGIRRLRLTADADNVPSLKLIERNGGVLSGEAISATTGRPIRQYWIEVDG